MSTFSTPSFTAAARPLAAKSGERDEMRIHEVRSFLDRYAPALHATLEAVAGAEGAQVIEDLVEALSERWPDPALVTRLIKRARDLLAESSFEQIDQAGRTVGRQHLHERVNWFGARLTDLAG